MTGRRWFWNQCWWMPGNYHRRSMRNPRRDPAILLAAGRCGAPAGAVN